MEDVNDSGMSPLHSAAAGGHTDCIKVGVCSCDGVLKMVFGLWGLNTSDWDKQNETYNCTFLSLNICYVIYVLL